MRLVFTLAFNLFCKEADCWSFGMFLYELMEQKAPFHDVKGFGVEKRILEVCVLLLRVRVHSFTKKRGNFRRLVKIDRNCTNQFYQLGSCSSVSSAFDDSHIILSLF